jgi:hypothetical protein
VPSPAVVPEGYFAKDPGVIARCPPGEYKSGLGALASCTKCALGVTTLVVTAAGVTADGATKAADCRALLPGYFAKTFGVGGFITEAQQCQTGDYCPGGDTFTTANAAPDDKRRDCPTGTYTDKIGATSVNECSKSTVLQHGICHTMHAYDHPGHYKTSPVHVLQHDAACAQPVWVAGWHKSSGFSAHSRASDSWRHVCMAGRTAWQAHAQHPPLLPHQKLGMIHAA